MFGRISLWPSSSKEVLVLLAAVGEGDEVLDDEAEVVGFGAEFGEGGGAFLGGGGVLLDDALDGGESRVDLLDAAGLLVTVGFKATEQLFDAT